LRGLVPTSDITIMITIVGTNITPLCRLCPSGNAKKHNYKGSYDRHNHNHGEMIDHFLMIMSVVMIMSPLRYLFPLDHKKLMFMIMFTIVMSLMGTKPIYPNE